MRLAAEREHAILREARLRGTVRVADLAERLDVSAVTIRRDITRLVDEGLLERVHGGARLVAAEPGRRQLPQRATLGLVVPSAAYYYPRVIRGAEAAAGAHDARLVLAVSHYDQPEERSQVARLVRAGVDGILISTSAPPDLDPDVTKWLASIGVPTVLVERRVDQLDDPSIEYVRTDHAAGARMAVEHLRSLGHERIGLLARAGSPTSRWLVEGFKAALGGSPTDLEPAELSRLEGDPRAGQAALAEWLERASREGITAALVHTDEDAMVLVQVAAERGISVPDDLAIVAYDDEVAALASVPLTAVAPPKHDVGRTAVEMLMGRLSSGVGPATRHVNLLPTVEVRASTTDRI